MLSLFVIALAAGGPADAALTWDAPADCPSRDQVVDRAVALFGPEAYESQLEVSATVERRETARPWHLELTVRTDAGEHRRALDAERCEALADVVALVWALGLDPSAMENEPARDPSEVERTVQRSSMGAETDASPQLTRTRKPPPRHAGRDGVGFGVRLMAGGEYGALPGGSGGGRLVGALLTRRFRVEANGSYWLPRPARLGTQGVGADVRLTTGGVDGCVRLYAGESVEFPLCIGAEMGLMRADSVGTATAKRVHAAYASVRLSPAISWRVADWVGLWLGVEGFAALARPRFQIGDNAVFLPEPVGFRALAGVEFGF